MTVEEARNDLEDLVGPVAGPPLAPAHINLMAAADAYALAVLEEAEATGGYDSLTTRGIDLRARINAPGKGD